MTNCATLTNTTDHLTDKIIGAAIAVHNCLGPGLLESAYENCLHYELHCQGIQAKVQQTLPVRYRDIRLDCGYRLDLVVEEEVIVEIKAVKELLPVHEAQLLSYLKLSNYRKGLLINFNVTMLKDGIKRRVL